MTEPTNQPTAEQQRTPEQRQLDQEIIEIRDELGRGSGWLEPQDVARLEALYKQRFPSDEPSDEDAPTAPITTDAPQKVSVDWGPGEPSAQDAQVRGQIESFFGRLGVTAGEAGELLAIARLARDVPVTDEEWAAAHLSTERTLRQQWGRDFERKMTVAHQIADMFERAFGNHPDIHQALENGFWLEPQVLERLAAIGERNGVAGKMAALAKTRAEMMKEDEGTIRGRALFRQLESQSKSLWGAS